MSLVSASGFVGGLKEYMYRGIQQLPIVLAATSLLFTIATGSISHAILALGLIFIVPTYTFLLQSVFGWLFGRYRSGNIDWTRSTGDACNILQSYDMKKLRVSIVSETAAVKPESVPSYWLTSLGFFIGYILSNAVHSLVKPSEPNADPINIERRKSHAVYSIAAISVFCVLMLAVRFSVMRGCEGRGTLGIFLSIVLAIGSGAIGAGFYEASWSCNRSWGSDLLGILSQMLPASSTSPHPIVCAESYD